MIGERIAVWCVWALCAAPVAAEPYPFDRVFTTPAERVYLDAVKAGSDPPAQQTAAEPQRRADNSVAVSGVMIRGDGQTMVWIDGKSTLSATPYYQDIATRALTSSPGLIAVQLQQKRKTLKPGQVWLLNDNRVVEAYNAPQPQKPEALGQDTSSKSQTAELPLSEAALKTLMILKQQ